MARSLQPDDLQPDDTPATPTPKEAQFLNMYLDHGDVFRAAIDSGIYKPKGEVYRPNAVTAGSRVLEKFKPEMRKMMEQKGLSFIQLLTKLNDGLDAESSYLVGRGEDRHVETYPDHRSRSKYLEMGFKLLGAFPSTPAVVKISGDKDAAPIAVQHFETIKALPLEERKRRLDEMIETVKRTPLRIAR